MADQAPKNAGILSSVFAIVAFLILIVIVIWGLVHLAGLTGDWFGRFFGGSSANTITVTAPKETNSGEPFAVSWHYSTNTKGSYALLYQCKNDLDLKAAPRADTTAQSVPCGTAYSIGPVSNISLTAFTKGASTTLPISIIFLPSATGTASAQGSATIIVHASSAPVNTETTQPSTQPSEQKPSSKPATSEQTTSEDTGVTNAGPDPARPDGAHSFGRRCGSFQRNDR